MSQLTDREIRELKHHLPAVAPAGQAFKVVNADGWVREAYTYTTLGHAISMLKDAREAGHVGATVELKASR